MLAVYAEKGDQNKPLSGLRVGEQPNPSIPDGWVRVTISHASLNRHDIFTLMGISARPEGITFPIILGNDGAGKLDDGTEIGIYPILNQPEFINNELMDPQIRRVCGYAEAKRDSASQRLISSGCFCLRNGLVDRL